MLWAAVESVAGGTELIDECAGCTADRVQRPMVALTPDGVVCLGVFTECETCGTHFRCGYCGRFVTVDALEIWDHVLTRHGEHGDG